MTRIKIYPAEGLGAHIRSVDELSTEVEMVRGLIVSESIEAPVGFSLPTVLSGMQVFKNGKDYSCNLRPIDFIDTKLIANVIHVDIATGDDTNSGSTWQNPVKSIWRAIELALAPTAGIDTRIFIKAGTYPRENSFLKNNVRWPDLKNITLTFEAKYGRAIIGAFSNNVWTLEGGQSNVYTTTITDAVIAVNPSLPTMPSSLQSKVRVGHTQYINVTSIAEVESTEGSLWVSGTSVYVHPHGSVIANNLNTRVYEHKELFGGANFGNIYCRNIDTEGGRLGFIYSGSSNKSQGMLVTDNTSHRYCIGGSFASPQTWNVFDITDMTLKAHFDTDASYSSTDGFSVAGAGSNQNCTMLTVNCTSSHNGLLTQLAPSGSKPSSVNGFTAHDGLTAISIGGEYTGTAGTPIAIVHADTKAWVIGAVAGDSEGDLINGKGILTGGASAADAGAQLWLDSCTLYGCDRELTASGGGEILLRNHTGSGEQSASTGTITTY